MVPTASSLARTATAPVCGCWLFHAVSAVAGLPRARWMHEDLSRRGQLRVKALTVVVSAGALLTLLLHDWGDNNVFSPIRPTLRAVLNRVYGLPQPSQSLPPGPQPPQRSSD